MGKFAPPFRPSALFGHPQCPLSWCSSATSTHLHHRLTVKVDSQYYYNNWRLHESTRAVVGSSREPAVAIDTYYFNPGRGLQCITLYRASSSSVALRIYFARPHTKAPFLAPRKHSRFHLQHISQHVSPWMACQSRTLFSVLSVAAGGARRSGRKMYGLQK